MNTYFLIPAVLILGLFASCADGSRTPGGKPDLSNPLQTTAVLGHALHTAAEASAIRGSYTGVLPCADCEGIATGLQLEEDGTYRLTITYQGKGDGQEYVTEGKWSLDGSRITLGGSPDAPAQYLAESDRLIVLDMEGKRIEGSLKDMYVLKKQ